MKFLEFISAVNIFEAAKDCYSQMFTNLIPTVADLDKLVDDKSLSTTVEEFEERVNNDIDWAMRVLKKQDKIIWYLRFVKVSIISDLAGALWRYAQEQGTADMLNADPPHPMMVAAGKLQDMKNKAIAQLSKKMGFTSDEAYSAVADAENSRFKRKMEHFMSLNIAAIEEYVFSNQTPRQILSDWTPIEDLWKSKRKSNIAIDREDTETLIEYPDGSEWVNINKGYCDKESEAMGHCGNAGAGDNDTILSYRTIEEVDGEKMWRPHLTFILDTETGLLGETKGRGNGKPSEKYHDVIVDLLRLPEIKGIKGGGYLPENNFKLADLPQETQEELVEEKPGLADIEYDYNKRGMTKDLLKRMEGMWEETQMSFPVYHPSKDGKGAFHYDTRYNMQEFLDAYGGHSGKYIGKILSGDEHIDIAYDGAAIDDLWSELSPTIQHQVGEWIIDEHADDVEEWKEENDKDYDGTDARDTWDIIKEYEISEITDSLERGYWRGDEVGAESAMYESLESWLQELPNEHDLSLSLSPGWDGSDDRQDLVIPEEEMVNIVSNHLEDVEYASDLDQFAQFKELESPYNGWEGHDDDAAKEEAEHQLYEAGVLTG